MYTTLYKILRTERIEIPIIQRDYAQGRESKVYLRERLLGGLINALKKNELFNLDFVYGTKEHNAMWPLDGQQRITTLWLLHWYLAIRTSSLSTAKQWLEHFTYETRTSSRDFCKSLCSLDAQAFNESKMKIVDFIKDQTWYYSKYDQDPTIQGMLRTLGGTNIKNTEEIDITDGIEEFLQNDDNCQSYWDLLTADNCPICFLYRDMKDEDLPLSDDLYIKMNARGKQLTDFENFKADLIGYAPNPDRPGDLLLDVQTASLIDNEWTDVFWKEACDKKMFKVDDIYFKFLRRYFLDRIIATSNFSVEETIKLPSYQKLYKGTGRYDGLKEYGYILTADTISHLTTFFSRWNNEVISPHWNRKEAFAFIPEYIVKETDRDGNPTNYEVSTISQKERAVFHAVVCYYENNECFNKTSFEEWLRFVWNIVENSNLDTENAMIGAIRLFEELRSHSGSILQFLASNEVIHSNYATRQMEEERFKARLLTGDHASVWRPLIYEAENHGFFRGNISCLLRHGDKEFVEDKNCFKLKFSNAQRYFDDNGIRAEYAVSITKALIKTIHHWGQINGHNLFLFDTSANAWKQNILNNDNPGYYREIDAILSVESFEELPYVQIEDNNREWTVSSNKIKKVLAMTDFLGQDTYYGEIVRSGSVWRLCWAYGVQAFYPYRKSYGYNFDWIDHEAFYAFRRNELLHHPNIHVNENQNPECEGVYWDWTIYFDYNGSSYLWDNQNKVYLLNRQNNKKKRDSQHKNEKEDKYFCIHMDELLDITQQGFLMRLTNLAREAES